MAGFRFRCTECATTYGEDDVRLVCPACAKRQEPGGVTRGVLEVEIDELPASWPEAPPSHPDFLTSFLPLPSAEYLPPLAVGGTPLVAAPRLRQALGQRIYDVLEGDPFTGVDAGLLWIKIEIENTVQSLETLINE